MKYNKNFTTHLPKPKVFFIDTGSGKSDDVCQMSNKKYLYSIYNEFDSFNKRYYDALHYLNKQYCFAYANIMGYYRLLTNPYDSTLPNQIQMGGIIGLDTTSNAGASSTDFYLRDLWVSDNKNSITGLSGIIAPRITAFNNLSTYTYTSPFLPMNYYNATDKMQVNSNPLASAATYDNTVNNKTKAALIAKFAVKASLGAPAIVSPY